MTSDGWCKVEGDGAWMWKDSTLTTWSVSGAVMDDEEGSLSRLLPCEAVVDDRRHNLLCHQRTSID